MANDTHIRTRSLTHSSIHYIQYRRTVVPEDNIPIIFAPSDAAVTAALTKLGLTPDQLTPDLIVSILKPHIAYATGLDVDQATSLSGNQVMFFINNAPATLGEFLVADPSMASVAESGVRAGVQSTIACPTPIAIFTDTVFPPASLPVPGPSMGPSPSERPPPGGPAPPPPPPPPVQLNTIGALVNSVCPEVRAMLNGPDVTILSSIVLPKVSQVSITPPPASDTVVLVIPTNDAFNHVLQSGVDPNLLNNITIVSDLVKQHIGLATSTAATSAASLLPGAELEFLDGAVPTQLSTLDAPYGAIKDSDAVETAKVLAVANCGPALYAFKVDMVLIPQQYEPSTPGPAPGPLPAASPSPAPMLPPPTPTAPPSSAHSISSMASLLFVILKTMVVVVVMGVGVGAL